MVMIFPIGVTAAYSCLLHKNRDKIKQDLEIREKDEELMSLSFLFDPYKPEYWYFEIIETIRRLLMTGVLSVIEPGSYPQLSYGLSLSIFFTILFSFLKPYHSRKDNWIAILSSAQQIPIFLASSFMKYNSLNLDGNARNVMLMDTLIMTSIVVSFLLLIWWAFFLKDDLSTSTTSMAKKSLKNGINSGSGDIEEIGVEMKDRSSSQNPVRNESDDKEEQIRLLKQTLKMHEDEIRRQKELLRTQEEVNKK